MQNNIFDIFENRTFGPRTISNVSKSTHGSGTISRGPVKPNTTGPAQKKVLGDLRSNVLCDVGNITNRPLSLASKGGAKNILSHQDISCKPGNSFGLQKTIQSKKLKPDSQVDGTTKQGVLTENNVQTTASCSRPSRHENSADAVSCGVGNVFPKHMQLTSEDTEKILGNLTSFRREPEEFVFPEIFPIEDNCAYPDYDPYQLAPPFIVWKDPSDVPLPKYE